MLLTLTGPCVGSALCTSEMSIKGKQRLVCIYDNIFNLHRLHCYQTYDTRWALHQWVKLKMCVVVRLHLWLKTVGDHMMTIGNGGGAHTDSDQVWHCTAVQCCLCHITLGTHSTQHCILSKNIEKAFQTDSIEHTRYLLTQHTLYEMDRYCLGTATHHLKIRLHFDPTLPISHACYLL